MDNINKKQHIDKTPGVNSFAVLLAFTLSFLLSQTQIEADNIENNTTEDHVDSDAHLGTAFAVDTFTFSADSSWQQDMSQEVAFSLSDFQDNSQPALLVPNQTYAIGEFNGPVNVGAVGAESVPAFPPFAGDESMTSINSVMYTDTRMIGIVGLAVLGLVGAAVAVGGTGGVDNGVVETLIAPEVINVPNTPPVIMDGKIISLSDNNDALFIPKAGLLKFTNDANNDALTLSVTDVVDATYNGMVGNTFKLTPTAALPITSVAGALNFDVTVSDGKGGFDTGNFIVDIVRQSLGGTGANYNIFGTAGSEIILAQNSMVDLLKIEGKGGNDFINVENVSAIGGIVANGGVGDDMIMLVNNTVSTVSSPLFSAVSTGGSDKVLISGNQIAVTQNSIDLSVSLANQSNFSVDINNNDILTTTKSGDTFTQKISVDLKDTGAGVDFLNISKNNLISADNTMSENQQQIVIALQENSVNSMDTIKITDNVLRTRNNADSAATSIVFNETLNGATNSNDTVLIAGNMIDNGAITLASASPTSSLNVYRFFNDTVVANDNINIDNNTISIAYAPNAAANTALLNFYMQVNNQAVVNDTIQITNNSLLMPDRTYVGQTDFVRLLFTLTDTSTKSDAINVLIDGNVLNGLNPTLLNVFENDLVKDNTDVFTVTNNTLNSSQSNTLKFTQFSGANATIDISNNVMNVYNTGVSLNLFENTINIYQDIGGNVTTISGNSLTTDAYTSPPSTIRSRIKIIDSPSSDSLTISNNSLESSNSALFGNSVSHIEITSTPLSGGDDVIIIDDNTLSSTTVNSFAYNESSITVDLNSSIDNSFLTISNNILQSKSIDRSYSYISVIGQGNDVIIINNNLLTSDKGSNTARPIGINVDVDLGNQTVIIDDNSLILFPTIFDEIQVKTGFGNDTILVKNNVIVGGKILVQGELDSDYISFSNNIADCTTIKFFDTVGFFDGADTIAGFIAGDTTMKIDLSDPGFTTTTFPLLLSSGAVTQVGADTIINLALLGGEAGESITLLGVNLSDLVSDNFML